MWFVTDNYTCHTCAKGFLDSNFNQAVINKMSNFHEIDPNFTYSQKSQFFKHNWRLIDQLLLPYKFLWQWHVMNLLFSFLPVVSSYALSKPRVIGVLI